VYCVNNAGRGGYSRLAALSFVFAGALALAACSGQPSGWSGLGTPTATGPTVPSGAVIGTGNVRVAMLLPSTASGNAGALAKVFQNAAELALNDFPGNDIQVIVKDTAGTSDGARAAAQSAIKENSELIIGPIFSASVAGAGSVARQAGVPIVAFSTDSSVAARGVYLMSFLPQQDVQRIISFAVKKGRKSFAALLPNNGYGTVTEAAFRQAVAKYGGRVVAIERYTLNKLDMQAKAESIARAASKADALFMPDGGEAAPFLAQILTTKRVNLRKVKILGSGQWDNPRVLQEQALAGAWFPAPDKSGYANFASRYAQKFGSAPPRTATLAYDATILAAGLVRSRGAGRFSNETLTNRDGFLGIDGVFRFLPSGGNERGLAIYEVKDGTARILNSAPRTFGAGS